jgi:hypothetical protein
MGSRSARIPWHEWSLVVETDGTDCDSLARRLGVAISLARTLDALIEAIDRFGDREGLQAHLELEPRWDGVQDPNELRATFLSPQVASAVA